VLHKDKKIELLKHVPLFARMSKHDLERVSSLADEIDLPAGKELTREGERGREFFVLIEGDADVIRGGEKLNTLGPGDFFGEISLVSGRPRTATVTATSPVRALVVTDQAFGGLMRTSPELQATVLEAVVERLPHDVP
jgi:CRP/FNR family transcriptional regulator, cyclic AMP receptor protein